MSSFRLQPFELIALAIILLMAGLARFAALEQAPPGMTHDEADHGLDAVGVIEGVRPIYFTVGYGREPIFDYLTAPVMLVLGRNYLAGRLTAGLLGMALLLLCWAWARKATDDPLLALALMAGLAFSFWGIAVSRQALRTITQPVLFMATAVAIWAGLRLDQPESSPRWPLIALAGLLLGLMGYTYLPARIMWSVFPALWLWMLVFGLRRWRADAPGWGLMLALGMLAAAPLAIYLWRNPGAEARLDQLSGPISALIAGDPVPLWINIQAGLGMIFLRGDDLWLYSIPGKPLLGPLMGVLFGVGFVLALLNVLGLLNRSLPGLRAWVSGSRRTADAFMLLTLAAGLVPALVTGLSASSTRVIGLMPALYYFPALAVAALAQIPIRSQVAGAGHALPPIKTPTLAWATYGLVLLISFVRAGYDYFIVWANAPDVRVAYHSTMDETFRYLEAHPEIGPAVSISTITPDRVHDPALAAMRLDRTDLAIRWFDGRHSLVLPAGGEVLLAQNAFAPIDPALMQIVAPQIRGTAHLLLRPDDRNRPVDLFTLFLPPVEQTQAQAQLGSAAELLRVDIRQPDRLIPGSSIEVISIWRLLGPTPEACVLFSQTLDQRGALVAQQDQLGHPSMNWRTGDTLIQLHHLSLPPDLPPGSLHLIIGAYTREGIVRLPVTLPDGSESDHYSLPEALEVQSP